MKRLLQIALICLMYSCHSSQGSHNGTYVTHQKIRGSAHVYVINEDRMNWYSFHPMAGVMEFEANCVSSKDSVYFPEEGGVWKPNEEGLITQDNVQLHRVSGSTSTNRERIGKILQKTNKELE